MCASTTGKDAPGANQFVNYCGTQSKPVQVLVRDDDHIDLSGMRGPSLRSKAWKMAYEEITRGFGFGTVVHNIRATEYASVCKCLKLNKAAGDVVTSLSSMQAPPSMRENYMGPEEKCSLVRLGARRNSYSILLESLIVAQQWLLSFVLQRGLAEAKFGVNTGKRPTAAHTEIVTTVQCRFKVTLHAFDGMGDYLRVIDDDMKAYDVDVGQSHIMKGSQQFPLEGLPEARSGWPRNKIQSLQNKKWGSFLVLSLFPTESTGFYPDECQNIGIYVTVSSNIVRGFTGERNGFGRYYEYVVPPSTNATAAPTPSSSSNNRHRRTSTATNSLTTTTTFIMRCGSSLILPSHLAVQLGAPMEGVVQVFGYLLKATPASENIEMDFSRLHDTAAITEDPFISEYSSSAKHLALDEGQTDHWEQWKKKDAKSRAGVIGTIPSLMKVEMNNPFRKSLFRELYDSMTERLSIKALYVSNPVMKLERYVHGQQYDDDMGSPERRMWMGCGPQWMVTEVPYETYDQVLKGKFLLGMETFELRSALCALSSNKPHGNNGDRAAVPTADAGSANRGAEAPAGAPTAAADGGTREAKAVDSLKAGSELRNEAPGSSGK